MISSGSFSGSSSSFSCASTHITLVSSESSEQYVSFIPLSFSGPPDGENPGKRSFLIVFFGVRRNGLCGGALATTGLRGVACSSFSDEKGERREDRKERGDFDVRTIAMVFQDLLYIDLCEC